MDLPNPGIKPVSLAAPALVSRFFTTMLPGKPFLIKIAYSFNYTILTIMDAIIGAEAITGANHYWNGSSNTLAIWWKEMTPWKRPWCWERLKAVGEGDDRGWDGWMASPTRWTWVWASCRSWWWTGTPGLLQSMGLERVRHDWVTELNWTELIDAIRLVENIGNMLGKSGFKLRVFWKSLLIFCRIQCCRTSQITRNHSKRLQEFTWHLSAHSVMSGFNGLTWMS